jgi:hypothetical protein
MPALGLTADAATYNALIWGCSHYGQNASVPKVGQSASTSVETLSVKDSPSVLSALLRWFHMRAAHPHESVCCLYLGMF